MQVPCTVQSLSHFYKFFSVIHHVILPLLIRERQSDFFTPLSFISAPFRESYLRNSNYKRRLSQMDALNPIADLPMGFGMALAQDLSAMDRFASLSPDEQRDLIDQTHRITSKAEMRSFVSALGRDVTPQDLAP